MRIHCKNNAIRCKFNDMSNDNSIAVMVFHCKNAANHNKVTNIRIASILPQCKNNVACCKINDMCIAVMLIQTQTTPVIKQINDVCTCCLEVNPLQKH